MDLIKKLWSKASEMKALTQNPDPFRFQGDGVDFKCKMIGVREIPGFTTDGSLPHEVLCYEQMLIAKDTAEHSGYHKRKVILNVSISGLKIRDAKCGAELYSFPTSSIPFIHPDERDPRAFCFTVSMPPVHKFFAIKTIEGADHVVQAIKEMFKVVFEMSGGRIEDGVPVADLVDIAVSPVARPNATTGGPHRVELFVRSPCQGFGMDSHQRRGVSTVMAPTSAPDPFGDFNFNAII